MKLLLKAICNEIKKYDKIYLVRHIGPDPDAICAQTALRDAIKLTFPSKSEVLAIGSSVAKFKSLGKLDKSVRFDYDNSLVIALDIPDKRRIDGIEIEKFKHVLKIDHHPTVDSFSKYDYVDEKATSTCEMVYKLLKNTKLRCNEDIAETLFLGIVSDSNRFLFNTDYKTFGIISEITYIYRFDIMNAYKKIYTRPISDIRLMGYISSNLKVTKNKFAYIELEDDIVKSLGADSSSASNMINDFNNITEVLVWMFVTYDEKNKVYKVNMRSRGPFINEIANKYNGGGHKFSSGARIASKDEVDDLIAELDDTCRKYLINEEKEKED
ncbi:MAG: bifunctional oligoribonuclease/PAP phosphatase NrnA [Bacilli bacterium]